jgi:tetratricopeptide (TPR) repeat protein
MTLARILFLIICGFFTNVSFACINVYRTKIDGTVFLSQSHRGGTVYFEKFDLQSLRSDSSSFLKNYQNQDADSIEYLSDYAATLVFLSHYAEAKSIYEGIEQVSPDRYTTASNLGTIYELIGMPDSALYWINRSIELNPASHGGSEWIHVKILEAQINGTTEGTASILGLDFGSEATPENINHYNLDKLSGDIYHQLSERLRFVEAPNKTVGNLFFDYGNVAALNYSLEGAIDFYTESARFGFKSDLMDIRLAEFNSRTRFTRLKAEFWDFVKEDPELALIFGLIGLIVILWISRKIYKKYKKWRA